MDQIFKDGEWQEGSGDETFGPGGPAALGADAVEVIREVLIASPDMVPDGTVPFPGWSLILAERIADALRVKPAGIGTEAEGPESSKQEPSGEPHKQEPEENGV